MTFVLEFKRQLDATDPRLWYLLIAMLVGALMETWRRALPRSFKKVPTRLKALPAMLIGTLVSLTPSQSAQEAFWNAVAGVLMGLLAVGGYEAKVRLLSGQGTRPEPVDEASGDKP